MTMCGECGKKLGFIEGYKHPILGKKHLLCNPCFNQYSESVEKWNSFVLSNSFITESKNKGKEFNWKKIAISFNQILNNNPNDFDSERNEILLDNKRQNLLKNLLMNIN